MRRDAETAVLSDHPSAAELGRGDREGERTAAEFVGLRIVIVIPAYNEEARIETVLAAIPDYVTDVIVVDDASQDGTAAVVRQCAAGDPRVVLLRHNQNQGVGGAMVTGFSQALELRADIVVKLDGDGQMSGDDLPGLLRPLIAGQADYAKGNRFRDFEALRRMPTLRRAGNTALSFLTKAAVGYWNCFDPCNGFFAIRGDVLALIPLHKLGRSFFFESSMLARLYLLGAVVRDVPMPARYGSETSHLSIRRVLVEFPPRLATCLVRRLVYKNFLYDFTIESLYLLTAIPLLTAGAVYGGWNWIWYARAGVGAPTGTVVISALLITLGFQVLLAAISEDIRNVPREPLGQPMERSRRRMCSTSETSTPAGSKPS